MKKAQAKLKSKKIKNCTKGWGCGNSCISKKKSCRVKVKENSKKLLNMLSTGQNSGADPLNTLSGIAGQSAWSEGDYQKVSEYFKQSESLDEELQGLVKIDKVEDKGVHKVAENTLETKYDEENAELLSKMSPEDISSMESFLMTPKQWFIVQEGFPIDDEPADTESKNDSWVAPAKDFKENYSPTSDIRNSPDIKISNGEANAIAAKVYGGKPVEGLKSSLLSKYQKNEGVDGMTQAESIAMSTWVSNDYIGINKAILSGKKPDKDHLKVAVSELQSALNKAPRYSPEAAKEAHENARNGEGKYQKIFDTEVSNDNYSLQRDMDMSPSAMADFIGRKASDAKSNNGTTSNDTFDAFGYVKGSTLFAGNVSVKVAPKKDGSSNARMVDKYKNNLYEAEALYPTGTKFRFDGVDKKYEAEFEKALEKGTLKEFFEKNLSEDGTPFLVYMTEL